VSADPKPAPRHVATAEEWAEFHAIYRGSRCRVCGGQYEELHHLVPRSQSGDDALGNLIPLCRSCHQKVEARDKLARMAVRGSLIASHRDYLRRKLGERWEVWLDRNYPLLDPEEIASLTGPEPELELELPPGKPCPTCQRRIPYPPRTDSPATRTVSYRVPTDEYDAHRDVMEAAARHIGVFERPHWQWQLNALAYALVLQDESLRGFAHREAA